MVNKEERVKKLYNARMLRVQRLGLSDNMLWFYSAKEIHLVLKEAWKRGIPPSEALPDYFNHKDDFIILRDGFTGVLNLFRARGG